VTTLTSREFNQDAARAKRAAKQGPVFITERGKPALVLLSVEDYRRLKGREKSIVDVLSMQDGGDIDFDPPRADFQVRPADFS
jgi:prevent-host-death family protein